MNADRVIVDANLLFKALVVGRADLRSPLNPSLRLHYFAPRFLFVELFKHKEMIMRASRLSEDDVLEALYTLINRIAVYPGSGDSILSSHLRGSPRGFVFS